MHIQGREIKTKGDDIKINRLSWKGRRVIRFIRKRISDEALINFFIVVWILIMVLVIGRISVLLGYK